MDGLVIAERLAALPALPLAGLAWYFPSKNEYVLRFACGTALTINVSQQHPGISLDDASPNAALSATPFQHQLRSRVSGSLVAVRQHGLDRVISFTISGGGDGFVKSEPATLIAELTGTNANLVLTNDSGRILGVHRVVQKTMNRYRQLLPGTQYVPPPPYERRDPRSITEEGFTSLVAARGAEKTLAEFDGLGPTLQRAVLLEAAEMPLWDAFQNVVHRPSEALAKYPAARRAPLGSNQLEQHRKTLRSHLARQVKQRKRRLADAEKNATALERAEAYRMQGDMLLAAQLDTKGQASVTVSDFTGGEVRLTVDPQLTTYENAEQYYARAKKSEQRVQHAERELPTLQRELERAEQALAAINELSDEAIVKRAKALKQEHEREQQRRELPGLRTTSPSGIPVIIGRSSKENDKVTFTQAKSRDLWFHAQGYRGSHVILQSRGREVPFDDVLFAAALAAGYSEASDSGNVPVDYTERKHVWRQKGGGPGAVHFTQYRTVWVDPRKVTND